MSRLVPVLPFVALLSTVAFADTKSKDTPAEASMPSFESLDRNADQRLSRSEAGFDRVLSQVFADTDVDGDGYVTKVEFAAISQQYNVAAR